MLLASVLEDCPPASALEASTDAILSQVITLKISPSWIDLGVIKLKSIRECSGTMYNYQHSETKTYDENLQSSLQQVNMAELAWSTILLQKLKTVFHTS